MKRQRIVIFLLLLLFATTFMSCSPGHVGSNKIAFLRDGNLWTIDPDGTNAFEVFADNNSPVVGYSWSPNHQILTFRALDADYAKTSQAKHLASNPLTGSIADLPSSLNTVGIDGGSPIPIIFSSPTLRNSNAWWNTTGNRLIYREETMMDIHSPDTVLWWVSQNDQPGGIARKLLQYSYSIPSISPDNSQVLGISQQGLFTSQPDGANVKYIVHRKLTGHPLFATLERALWQPTHQHPEILYALEPSTSNQTAFTDTSPLTIQLILNDLHGHLTTLVSCACTQFSWAPDGNHILYSSGSTYTIHNLTIGSSFSISGEDGSVPYWSPDSQFLLLDGLHSLILIDVKNQQTQTLLNDSSLAPGSITQPTSTVGVNDLLQPVANSLWAADSRQFLFATRERLFWQGKNLDSGSGLYTVTIDSHGQLKGPPALVDSGKDIQAGWSYQDPSTSFLF